MNKYVVESLLDLADANNSNWDAIIKLGNAIDALTKRIEILEENAKTSDSGSGTGHYGAGPWG